MFSFYYKGKLTQKAITAVMRLINENLKIHYPKHAIRNRLNLFSIELLQNIAKYKLGPVEDKLDNRFVLRIEQQSYQIESRNLVNKLTKEELELRVAQVNALDTKQRSLLVEQELRNEKDSSITSANIGLYEIARRSGNRLEVDFEMVEDNLFYYTIKLHGQIGKN